MTSSLIWAKKGRKSEAKCKKGRWVSYLFLGKCFLEGLVGGELDVATMLLWPVDDERLSLEGNWNDDVLAEGQNTIVSNVARFTESFLQLFLDTSCAVQQVDLGVLVGTRHLSAL